jgi:hypothetical protein
VKSAVASAYVFPNVTSPIVIIRSYPIYTGIYDVFTAQTRMMDKLIVWFPCYPLPNFSAS